MSRTCGGEYIKLERGAVPCNSKRFAELWDLGIPGQTLKPPPAWQCNKLLRAVLSDVQSRCGHHQLAETTITFSPDGTLEELNAPAFDGPVLCYTFNAPGSFSRHLNVRNSSTHLWTAVLSSGDLLEYRRSIGHGGTFRLCAVTDPARCNGQRIVVTVAVR